MKLELFEVAIGTLVFAKTIEFFVAQLILPAFVKRIRFNRYLGVLVKGLGQYENEFVDDFDGPKITWKELAEAVISTTKIPRFVDKEIWHLACEHFVSRGPVISNGKVVRKAAIAYE